MTFSLSRFLRRASCTTPRACELNFPHVGVEFDVESLESRQMLAGDITVKVNGSDITLIGDSQDNSVSVFGLNDTVWVDAYGATSLSGDATSDSFDTGIAVTELNNLKVVLKGGNDNFDTNNIDVGGRETISTGGGDDFIGLGNGNLQGKVIVKSGGGNDDVYFDNAVANDAVVINTGGGDDELTLANFGPLTANGKVNVKLGGGADKLSFDPTQVSLGMQSIVVSGGGGVDTFDGDGVAQSTVEMSIGTNFKSFEIDLADA